MTFIEAIQSGFSKYVTFSGRASRSEYWYWALFTILVKIAALVLDIAIFGAHNKLHPLSTIISLAFLCPSISVFVRRLHDVGRSGWWYWIVLTIIGALFPLLYWSVRQGDETENQYGPAPILTP